MISQTLKKFARPLAEHEKHFVKQINNCYIQFAIEVEHPRELPIMLEKIKNATAGLYIRSDGYNLYDNYKNQETVTVHPIPIEIKTLSDCCDWIYTTYTPTFEDSLASIAADDHRIVINSNHSISDGGYFATLLQNIQDPRYDDIFKKKAPIPRDLRNDLLKDEFDEFLKNKKYYIDNCPSIQQGDLTYLNLQENVELPDSYNLLPKRLKASIKVSELSPYIYNKQTGKVKNMSDFLWTGLCMAINAKNGQYGPIGVGSCMDFRRLVSKDRVNQSFGNAFTNFTLAVQKANPRMTINEICSTFRKNFNLIKNNNWFYKEYMFPLQYKKENFAISHVSNVGPMRIKSPLKDFSLQVSTKEQGLRPYIQVTSYSKYKEETDMNDLILHLRFSNSVMSKKVADDIFDTYVYFLKNVDPTKKSGDVLDELIHFQESL